ncbi:QcrA and Rieske domain-containing protein [Pleomorphovibrio marinus]|uniref:QcrA and Rieske domain-containing protein n=1 Tax=Pleomorphovibrio marinus TaxID=2164132 RepID=UPI000E0A2623|nr:Rieske (2Fe-2S) protein [Pleomorphovibrio marinus]
MRNSTIIKTGKLNEERRDFIKKSGALTVMSIAGVSFFTSCSSDDDTEPTPTEAIVITEESVRIDLDQVADLNAAGGWILLTDVRMLVVNTGSNSFNALTSVCTHEGCDRDWSFANDVFTCACHGSRFNSDGSVVTGPATQPLRQYDSAMEQNILIIDRT